MDECFCLFEKHASGVREFYSPPVAGKKAYAELVLQLTNLPTQR
jgi:hypothetical protein